MFHLSLFPRCCALTAAVFSLQMATTSELLADSKTEAKVVHVYNWSDYVAPDLLKEFTKETGIQVIYDTFDSNEVLDAKLLAGKTGYDVVAPSAHMMVNQIAAGIFIPLDDAKLPNRSYQWDFVTQQLAELKDVNQYSVSYQWSVPGIGYNIDKINAIDPNAPIDSLQILFDPAVIAKFASCGVEIVDTAEELIPAALTYLGLDPHSRSPKDLEKVEELLLKVRPYIQKIHNSSYVSSLANGDICLAFGYAGDVLQARDRADEANNGVHLAFSIPKEGAQMAFDQFAIPVDAPHPENAYAFINFMLRPDIAARAATHTSYPSGNQAAQALLPPEIRNNPAIYPTPEVQKKLYPAQTLDMKTQRLVTRLWSRVRTGQ